MNKMEMTNVSVNGVFVIIKPHANIAQKMIYGINERMNCVEKQTSQYAVSLQPMRNVRDITFESLSSRIVWTSGIVAITIGMIAKKLRAIEISKNDVYPGLE